MIISGANSKRQPELATFAEEMDDGISHLPMSSRLDMKPDGDRLALAHNKFFCLLDVPPPSADKVRLQFGINRKGTMRPTRLTLQLVLNNGETLETAAGKRITLGTEQIDLSPSDIGEWIRHNGWTLHTESPMSLKWPVYTYNPYTNRPTEDIEQAVGAYSMEIEPRSQDHLVHFGSSTLEEGGHATPPLLFQGHVRSVPSGLHPFLASVSPADRCPSRASAPCRLQATRR